LVTFDFTGRSTSGERLISHKCAGKGEVIEYVYKWLLRSGQPPEYIAIIDHDIKICISQINRLIAIGAEHRLDSFAPALSRDSYYSFEHLITQPWSGVRAVDFIEIMFPFYRYELFEYCARHFGGTITAYGIDEFGIPAAQKILGAPLTAVIDHVVVKHLNPVASHKRTYRNGLSAYQERALIRRLAMERIALERTDLVGTAWYYRTFARLNGPGRFLVSRATAPWHWARRLISDLSRVIVASGNSVGDHKVLAQPGPDSRS